MKKDVNNWLDDGLESRDEELRPEYDLASLLKGAERGKYAEQYRAGTNLVPLAPDVAEAFPSAEAVNEALRLVMKLSRLTTPGVGSAQG